MRYPIQSSPLVLAFILALSMIFSSCQKEEKLGFISSATLESDLWKVSPSVAGTLLEVSVREGDSVHQGQAIAWIDSIPLVLKLGELQAGYGELFANIRAREAEVATLQTAHEGIEREFARATKLVADGAATVQRKDDLETQKSTSISRIAAARSAIEALRSRNALLFAQEKSLRDQIQRCQVKSPASGRIMTRYRNNGEASIPGRPLVEIGRTDTLWAEFFIPQNQLAKFHLGQSLKIRLDAEKEPTWVPGKLSWIASEAEFTPKGVQTREARNELIFRARALAPNHQGQLKRGMPVEVWE
jgi:HlyD family secretion protein